MRGRTCVELCIRLDGLHPRHTFALMYLQMDGEIIGECIPSPSECQYAVVSGVRLKVLGQFQKFSHQPLARNVLKASIGFTVSCFHHVPGSFSRAWIT